MAKRDRTNKAKTDLSEQIGKRYTRRQRWGLAVESLHLIDVLRPAGAKAAAHQVLRDGGFDVEGLLALDPTGAFLRAKVYRGAGPEDSGPERDSPLGIAADIAYHAGQMEGFAQQPNGAARQASHAFAIGKLAVLALVYEIERAAREPGREKAQAERIKYTEAQKDQWRDHYATRLAGLSVRSAVPHVLRQFTLPDDASETVRKALGKRKQTG